MDNLNNIPKSGSYGAGVDLHNDNYQKIGVELQTLRELGQNNKGYFETLSALQSKYPTPQSGWQAYVANAASSTGYYVANVNSSGNWAVTAAEAPPINVDLAGYAKTGGSDKTVKEVEDEIAQLAEDLKLKEGSIKPKHTDFLRESKNLFDIESVKLGYDLTEEGEEIVNIDVVISDYIPVEDIDELYFNSDFLIRIYFYGEAKNFILSVKKNESIFSAVVPKMGVDIRYARLRFARTHINTNIMVNSESETIPFEPYGVFFTKNPNVITEKSVIPNDTTFIKDSPNLFKKEGIKLGYDLSTSDGEEFINSNTAITDFIEFEGVGVLVGTLEMSINAYFYDENKTFLGRRTKAAQSIDFYNVPLGSRYVRFRVAIVSVDVDIMVNEGHVLLPYEPYGLSFTKKVIGIADGGLDDFIINEGDSW